MNYLTREEVAQRLRVSVRTVCEYVARGVLSPPARLGRKPLWTEYQLALDVERSIVARGAERDAVRRIDPRRTQARRGRPRKF